LLALLLFGGVGYRSYGAMSLGPIGIILLVLLVLYLLGYIRV